MAEDDILEKIMKEKISADHLLYVSMKYTKTCDVMINLIKRWKIMMDYSFDGLLDKAKKKKMIKNILVSSCRFVLLVAVPAVYRSVSCGLEWYFSFFLAVRTCHFMHFTLSVGPV